MKGESLQADRTAAIDLDDGRQELAIEVIETEGVDLHLFEAEPCRLHGHAGGAQVIGEIAHPAQQAVGDPRCPAGGCGCSSQPVCTQKRGSGGAADECQGEPEST